MPKEASITLDQTDPKPGDTITFSTEGEGSKSSVTINVFHVDSDQQGPGGMIQSERKPVGEPFTLGQWDGEASVIVYLMTGNKLIASTSFYA